MADNILVKTPLTTNGTDPVFDGEGKRIFTESILRNQSGSTGARAVLEKRNQSLPAHLKVIIEDYDGEVGVSAPNEVPQKVTNVKGK